MRGKIAPMTVELAARRSGPRGVAPEREPSSGPQWLFGAASISNASVVGVRSTQYTSEGATRVRLMT